MTLLAVLCIENKGYEASLEKWKVYPSLGEEHGLLRVVDETGEAYLYPKDLFVPLELALSLIERLFKETTQS